MARASTIDEVLEQLDIIIDACRAENNAQGYFAYVYRRTTAAIKEAIESGRFSDNARMEAFDVTFANLYLRAYEQYQAGGSCPNSWQLAFEVASEKKAVLQHVLLGMNAHINLDLGVAAGNLMAGKDLNDLKEDFLQVNDILQEIIDELQDRVARVSPVFSWVDWLGRNRDERFLDFSMRAAREQAWAVAHQVWEAEDNRQMVITKIDATVASLGNQVGRPRARVTRWFWRWLALTEGRSIARNIDRLRRM